MIRKIVLSSLACCLAPLHYLGAQDFTVSLASITPDATDVTDKIFCDKGVSQPTGTTIFVYKGTAGTTYSAVFNVSEQPAVLVGVGANISSVIYDETLGQVTIAFSFDRDIVGFDKPGCDGTIPKSIFMFGITQGFEGAGRGPPPGAEAEGEEEEEDQCFGPASEQDDRRKGGGSEEGDDQHGQFGPGDGPPGDGDGPPGEGGDDSSGDDEGQDRGPPIEARGTYMSTDTAKWCVKHPNSSNPAFGFRLLGPPGESGFFKMFIPKTLVDFLGEISGKTLEAKDLAIYNGDFQSSVSVTDQDGGALINIEVDFVGSATHIKEPGPGQMSSPFFSRARKISTQSSSTVQKDLTLQEKQELSLAPNKTKYKASDKKVEVYGFVTDEDELAGGTVTIERELKNGTTKTIGTAAIQSDGSYSAKVSAEKVFPGNARTATVSASAIDVVRSTIRESLKTSLSQSASKNRR